MHILLVEDDLNLGPALLAALKAEGMSAQWVRRAADARAAMGPEVDLVLLDRALAGQEGLDLLRHWRTRRVATPVIVITARSALTDRLEGLVRRRRLPRQTLRDPGIAVACAGRASPPSAAGQ